MRITPCTCSSRGCWIVTTDDLQEALSVCVGYLCARLEEIEAAVRSGEVRLTDTGIAAFVKIGRDLCAAAENVAVAGAVAQDVVVRFTDSESKPQDFVSCDPVI